MPELVNTQETLSRLLAEALEPVVRGVGVHRLSKGVYKKTLGVVPLIAQGQPLLGLGRPVLAQHIKTHGGQLQGPLALHGLSGVRKGAPAL